MKATSKSINIKNRQYKITIPMKIASSQMLVFMIKVQGREKFSEGGNLYIQKNQLRKEG